jgi:hypothetical protein
MPALPAPSSTTCREKSTVKNIRHLSTKEARENAEEALRRPTVREVSAFLTEKLRELKLDR